MANVIGNRVAYLLCLFLLAGPVQGKDKPLSAVADLRYGAALYQYYQNKHLEALSELMVAQKRGGIKGHGDDPELMQGGFHLAYGMERTAADIFERLLAANRSQDIQNAAWFYLAKLRYLRGDYEATDKALEFIGDDPNPALAVELRVLRINLALRRGDVDQASLLYDDEAVRASDWVPYLLYNFGAAHSRVGNFERSIAYFNSLFNIQQRSEEFLTLYDKSMTAAGYSFLFGKNYPQAISHFSQVRLDSSMSNAALLGYGWAATEMEDYQTALKPWDVLSKRSLIDENTQEALIAIPFAYEKLGREGLALKHYRLAEANFTEEIAKLDAVIGSMQGYAIREALNIDRSADFNWLNYTQKNNLSPQVSYLIELFSKETFLGMVQELRDLIAIQEMLGQWSEKLEFYGAMLADRDVNRASEMQVLSGKNLEDNLAQMSAQRDALAGTIADIEQHHRIELLLNEEEAEQYQRLVNAEKNITLLSSNPQALGEDLGMTPESLARSAWKVRALKGRLLWHASEQFSARLWGVKKQLAELNKTLSHNQALRANIDGVVAQGFDLQPYHQKIASASETLLSQTVDIELAIEAAQDNLRNEVLQVLKQQRERIYHYMALSRLSIARILDLAAKKQQEESDKKQLEEAKATEAQSTQQPQSVEDLQVQQPGGGA